MYTKFKHCTFFKANLKEALKFANWQTDGETDVKDMPYIYLGHKNICMNTSVNQKFKEELKFADWQTELKHMPPIYMGRKNIDKALNINMTDENRAMYYLLQHFINTKNALWFIGPLVFHNNRLGLDVQKTVRTCYHSEHSTGRLLGLHNWNTQFYGLQLSSENSFFCILIINQIMCIGH